MNIALVCAVVFLISCSGPTNADKHYFWLDNTILESVQNGPVELLKSRPVLTYTDGSEVSNCTQYFEQTGDLIESAVNFSARSHYLVCDALTLAEVWPPAPNDGKFDAELSLCSKVDLSSFRHSLRPRIEGENITLTQLFGEDAVGALNTCTFEGEGRNFVLNAVLQVNAPNEPKRIWVWVIDEVLDSTYRSYKPVWFDFDETLGMWVAKQ